MVDGFDDLWSDLEGRLVHRTRIRNWTRDKGYFGEDFDVELGTDSVTVFAPGAANVQRVPRSDFHALFELWPGYLSETTSRAEISVSAPDGIPARQHEHGRRGQGRQDDDRYA